MRHLAVCLLAIVLTPLLFDAADARADDPPGKSRTHALIFPASDIPRLADHPVDIRVADKYTVKVWAPANQAWSLAIDGTKLTLSSKREGDDAKPRWQTVGVGELPKAAVTIVVATSETSEKTKNTKPVPLPAILILTNNPSDDPSKALDAIRGQVDSTEPTPDPRRTRLRTNKEGADFRPPATVQAWNDRAAAVREQLLVTMGLWPMPPKTALNPKVYGKVERDGYSIEKVVLETLPGFTLSGNLYRPIGKPGKLPVILCPHGHWADGRVNPEVQPRCAHWAKLGAVVFMYDMVGYNDSKPFTHVFLNDRLRRRGLSLVTLQTWNSIRALDWLTTLPDVDPARVGCTGESGGGTQTFLLTAIDDRVKVSAPVVMVSDSFQGGCVCENCAGLRIGTDNVEFAALTAPRPLKLVGASGDWTKLTMTNAYPTLRQVYSLYGRTDRISADVFDFPHNYNQTSRNAVYAFMGKWLLGIEDSSSTREGVITLEKPEDLVTFNEQTPAPSNRKTPAELENDLIAVQTRQLELLAPAGSPASWEASRALLRTSHRVRVGLVNPAPAELDAREVRRGSREGATEIHSVIGRKANGDQVPVARLIPKNPNGRLTVLASPHGKSILANDGQGSTMIKDLLARGQSVVVFDPLFVGEAFDPSNPVAHRPDTVHSDTYNPSVAAEQIQDLATVIAWARSQPDVREVSLIGQGRSGPQVLLALPLLSGLARTAVDLHEYDEGDGSTVLPAELDLPGLLQFGGFKAAAALSAPKPLWIYRTGPKFDRAWVDKAYGLADAQHVLKVGEGKVEPADLVKWIDAGE